MKTTKLIVLAALFATAFTMKTTTATTTSSQSNGPIKKALAQLQSKSLHGTDTTPTNPPGELPPLTPCVCELSGTVNPIDECPPGQGEYVAQSLALEVTQA